MTSEHVLQRQAAHAAIKRRVWIVSIWCWPVCIVSFLIGFIGFAGFVPPPSPAWTAQELADFFAGNVTGVRIGILIAMFSAALMLPFYAVISEEIRDIEGKPALLASIQWGGAVMLMMVFQFISLCWLLASYRQDISPEITQMLNDFCWFNWSMFIPIFSIQYLCMALAGFMDIRERPLWPRWAAWLNLWVAVTGAGGVLAVFFKKGPFAWNGIIGFWIPVIVFVIAMCVTAYLLHRRHRLEETQAAGAVPSKAAAA